MESKSVESDQDPMSLSHHSIKSNASRLLIPPPLYTRKRPFNSVSYVTDLHAVYRFPNDTIYHATLRSPLLSVSSLLGKVVCAQISFAYGETIITTSWRVPIFHAVLFRMVWIEASAMNGAAKRRD